MRRSARAGLTFMLAALVATPVVVRAQAVATTPNRELAKLQEKLAANPTSVAALRAVGLKLYELKRFAESRPVLEQARQLDRLGVEIVAARGETLLPGADAVVGRERYDGPAVADLAELPRRCEAVFFGHHHVHEHHIKVLLRQKCQRFMPVGGLAAQAVGPSGAQNLSHQIAIDRVVIDHQNPLSWLADRCRDG